MDKKRSKVKGAHLKIKNVKVRKIGSKLYQKNSFDHYISCYSELNKKELPKTEHTIKNDDEKIIISYQIEILEVLSLISNIPITGVLDFFYGFYKTSVRGRSLFDDLKEGNFLRGTAQFLMLKCDIHLCTKEDSTIGIFKILNPSGDPFNYLVRINDRIYKNEDIDIFRFSNSQYYTTKSQIILKK